jgi:antirestriction protein ArdC
MKAESRRRSEPPLAKLDWQDLVERALTMPGHLGDTYNRFYTYSFLNQLLLLEQGVREPVATYDRWQQLGRQVVRGSKAKAIIRPIVVKKKDEAGEVEDTYLRFKPVRSLFTLSETTGEELPGFEIPRWYLDVALERLSVKRVPFRQLNGNIQGYSHGREFAINPTAKYPTKTLFHELGHIVLGHTTAEQREEYMQHRGIREFQAEATAHLTTNELGIASEEEAMVSRGYLQNWLQDERPSDLAVRAVFSATDKILRAGRVAVAGTETSDDV